jgi:hypothetical protein
MVYFRPLTKVVCKKTTHLLRGIMSTFGQTLWPYRLGSIPGARSDILSNGRELALRCSAKRTLRAIVRKEPQ